MVIAANAAINVTAVSLNATCVSVSWVNSGDPTAPKEDIIYYVYLQDDRNSAIWFNTTLQGYQQVSLNN